MSKRTARKLLAVATLVASPAAFAGPDKPTVPASWVGDDARLLAVVMIDGRPLLVAPNTAPVAVSFAEYGRYLGETQPLVGPDGRPGCGNILAKGDGGCGAARERAVEKRLAAAAADKTAATTEASRDAAAKWRADESARVVANAKTSLAAKASAQAKAK